MSEKRADELVKGDVLDLKGDPYTVVKVRTKGKRVRLTIDGRRGSFTDEVKARTVYSLVSADAIRQKQDRVPSMGSSRGKSNDPVNDKHSPGPLRIEGVSVADLDVPFENDRVLVEQLGARLVGVEREGGRLVVPPVTDATVLGHLLTMHQRRFDGATVAEAKAWAKANPGKPESMQQVLDSLSLQRAYDLHDGLHKDLTAMPTPHWHGTVS